MAHLLLNRNFVWNFEYRKDGSETQDPCLFSHIFEIKENAFFEVYFWLRLRWLENMEHRRKDCMKPYCKRFGHYYMMKRLSWRHWIRPLFGEHAKQQNHFCNRLASWLHSSVLGLRSTVACIILHKPRFDVIRRQMVTRFSRFLLCAFQAYLRKAKLFHKSGREIKPKYRAFCKMGFSDCIKFCNCFEKMDSSRGLFAVVGSTFFLSDAWSLSHDQVNVQKHFSK